MESRVWRRQESVDEEIKVIEDPIWDFKPDIHLSMSHPVPMVFWRNFKKYSAPETFICLPVLILERKNFEIVSLNDVLILESKNFEIVSLNWKRIIGRKRQHFWVVVVLFGVVGNNGLPLTACWCSQNTIVPNNVNHQHPRNSRASQKFWKTGNF